MDALGEYERVPISFEVRSIFDVDGTRLIERAVDPYPKDYALEFPGSTVNWGLIAARAEETIVGGALVARDTPGVDMLEGRGDLALLWDLRVAPEIRGRGVGRAIFAAAERWAIAHGCRELKVETQNTNVAACRFYERQGCVLRSVNAGTYPDQPHEIQLLWFKELGRPSTSGGAPHPPFGHLLPGRGEKAT